MGKYFKEDNNQRISKASNLNVEALAEKAIRTAQWWQRPLSFLKKFKMPGGATRQRTRSTSEVGLEKLRTPSTTNAGETTYVEKLGKGVQRYVANTEIKPSIFSQLISFLTNHPLYKFLSKFTLAEFEKNRPEITQILDTAYQIPVISKTKTGTKVVQETVELRTILTQMIRNDNKVVINGNKIDALDAKTYDAIIADIKRLDDRAARYDLYRTLIGVTPPAVIGWQVKNVAWGPDAKKVQDEKSDVRLDSLLTDKAGANLNTFKAMSAPDQANALNKIKDPKLKEAITLRLKAKEYLKTGK